jgi:thioredoxin reductase (NADPH)
MVDGVEAFEGKQVHYRVRDAQQYHGQHLVICGGGDSALDWAIDFAGKAASVTLIHRRAEFRAAPASVARMRELEAAGQLKFIEGTIQTLQSAEGTLTGATVKAADGTQPELRVDHVFAFFGLQPKLGPIANWGLAMERKALKVDTEKFQTSEPGIFAVGDINTYPGKKKLILSGFHEAALAAFGAAPYIFPEKKIHMQYTTTSPKLHKILGVESPVFD